MNEMVLLWNSQNENIHPPKTQGFVSGFIRRNENSSVLL